LKNIAASLSLPGMSTLASKPVADAVDVECTDDELIVTLVDGRRVSAPLAWFPRLLRATPKQRANWRLIGRGVGIHWEDVDEDISVRTLLASWGRVASWSLVSSMASHEVGFTGAKTTRTVFSM